jgi:hypothetical protein
MRPSQSHCQQIVALLEDAICTRELAQSLELAARREGATEKAAIANLYRTLRVARHFQALLTKQPTMWLSRLP